MSDKPRWSKLLIVPPILVGVLVLLWAKSGREPPQPAEHHEPTRSVRIVEAPGLDLVPVAEGFGAVKPARVWTAVAQVQGRVVEIHPKLKNGELLPEGAPLLKIDPMDYELALAQTRAELAQLEVEAQNAAASLDIERRNLALARQELERNRSLADKGTSSRSAADQAERTMLGAETAVQNLMNTVALIPTRRHLLEAKIARAERDLSHTEIRAPFNLRVANVQVENAQYVPTGKLLFEGDAVDRVEVVAQVALSAMRRLFLDPTDAGRANVTIDKLPQRLAATRPLLRLDLGSLVAEWDARIVRISDQIDAETRTIGVVVAVDKPFEKVIPGYRPPLSKGMFVQVLLRGQPQPGRVVVPRVAVRNGQVLIADAEDRLRRRPVQVLFNQGPVAVISEGVTPGERVVVSDLVPAVDGMLLRIEVDEVLATQMLAAASGEIGEPQ
jgi:RND family efflux transporter MFP subunit